jgi:hypothetical protein
MKGGADGKGEWWGEWMVCVKKKNGLNNGEWA